MTHQKGRSILWNGCVKFTFTLLALLLSACDPGIVIVRKLPNPADCLNDPLSSQCKVYRKDLEDRLSLRIDKNSYVSKVSRPQFTWSYIEAAESVVGLKVMIATNKACTQELLPAILYDIKLVAQQQTLDVPIEGDFFICVFAITKDRLEVPAVNNGVRLVTDWTPPLIEMNPTVTMSDQPFPPLPIKVYDQTTVSYKWQQLSGPAILTLVQPEQLDPRPSASKSGRYILQLTASDEAGNQSSKSMTLKYSSVGDTFSVEMSATTSTDFLSEQIPLKSTGLAWVGGDYSQTRNVTAIWSLGGSSDAVSQELYVFTDRACTVSAGAPISGILASVTSQNLTVNADGAYWFKVKTTNNVANSILSECSTTSITVDTMKPTAPSAPGFSGTYSTLTTVSLSFGVSNDTHFSTHDIKVCTSNDCNANCLGNVQSRNSPVILSGLSNGSTYYGCVRGIDQAGNTTAFVASALTTTVDTQAPTGSITLAETVAGYSNTQSPAITLTKDADVVEYQLCSNPATVGNSCSGILRAWTTFADSPTAYNFGADGSAQLYVQFKDSAGNRGATVASNILIIDSVSPTVPTGVSVPVANNGHLAITFTPGPDASSDIHNVKACTSNNCITGCVGATTSASSPAYIASASLTNGILYYGCVQAQDKMLRTSAFVASSSSGLYDTVHPTGSITLAETVAGYSNTQSPAITLTKDADVVEYQLCSNPATVGNSCSGILRAWTTFADSPTAYNFGADGSAQLYVQFKDSAGNRGATVPSNISIIDSVSPTVPTGVSVPSSSNGNFNISFTAGTELYPSSFNIKACTDSGCSSGCAGATTTAASPGTIASGSLVNGGPSYYYGCVQGTDLAGNTSSWVASASVVAFSQRTMTYNGNGNTGGTVPTDATIYSTGQTVSVLPNSGSLVKTDYALLGWNSAADGSGSAYIAGNSSFAIGSSDVILYAQWTSAPAGTPASCAAGTIDSNGTLAGGHCILPATASGGTVSIMVQNGVTYRVHTFMANGTLDITAGGTVEVLLVGGGGAGGGGGGGYSGGGGGGGALIQSASILSAGSYNVAAGNGGIGIAGARGGQGGNSTFSNLIALGGGGGGGGSASQYYNGGNGGSGGGAAANGAAGTGSLGGNNGDVTTYGAGNGCPTCGAGGGGAGSAAWNTWDAARYAGVGKSSDFSGSTVTYAAGGMGGRGTSAGTIGGGGGGAGGNGTSGSDGSAGIVIIRYPVSASAACPTGAIYSRYASGGTCVSAPAGAAATCDAGFIDSNGNLVGGACLSPGEASGGSVSIMNQNGVTYRVHTFMANGSLDIATGGNVEVFLVGGGGAGGGGGGGYSGGGGGGGALIQSASILSSGSYNVAVGTGGSGIAQARGGQGGSSTFSNLIALGGGGGGGGSDPLYYTGGSGGSGGGAAASGAGGTGTSVGNTGDLTTFGAGNGCPSCGAGGGGAGGAAWNTWDAARYAGVGKTSDFSGSTVTYAAGGMGGTGTSAGTIGGGGGGAGGNGTSGSDGSTGIVIIRYPVSASAACPTGTIYSRYASGGACVSASAGAAATCDVGFIDSNGTLEGGACISPAEASGGSVSIMSQNGITYRVHTFLSSDTLDIATGGAVEAFLVGGGGAGGGAGGGFSGAGGGGGAVVQTIVILDPGSYSVVIGTGGAGIAGARGGQGGSSTFSNLIALGGGGGGGGSNPLYYTGGSGSSGGGAAASGAAGNGTSVGNTGSLTTIGAGNGCPTCGGGGGGAAGASTMPWNGQASPGPGQNAVFSGSSVVYAGGGGGGGTGGSANMPGGGGVGGYGGSVNSGSAGQSGIIIIRYPQN